MFFPITPTNVTSPMSTRMQHTMSQRLVPEEVNLSSHLSGSRSKPNDLTMQNRVQEIRASSRGHVTLQQLIKVFVQYFFNQDERQYFQQFWVSVQVCSLTFQSITSPINCHFLGETCDFQKYSNITIWRFSSGTWSRVLNFPFNSCLFFIWKLSLEATGSFWWKTFTFEKSLKKYQAMR